MNISDQLFEGKLVRLAPLDHEHDPEIEARWTQDPSYLRMLSTDPMRPLSVHHLKKQYEELEKKNADDKKIYHFRIRTLEDNRMVGFCELYWILWPVGNAYLRMGIGAEQDRRKGYGYEALRMLTRFAFSELNLYRLSADVAEYNDPALALFKKAGFSEEVRRRQALARDGRRWDAIILGLLAEDWKE